MRTINLLVCLAAAAIAGWGSAVAAPPPATPDPAVRTWAVPAGHEPKLTRDQEIALLRRHVKYVFVLYQENRSFDSYFGTFPGAEGLYSNPADQTPGFEQALINTDGTLTTVHPFRLGPADFAADTDDIDHSHNGIVNKMDITAAGVPKMDKFAVSEEMRRTKTGNPSLAAKQFGELTMAYEDGDTIPFLWRYANRFVLCDHIFQQMTGPSTPGNLAIIGAQTGATQLMRHPEQAAQGKSGPGVPVMNDADPLWGSKDGPASGAMLPANPKDHGAAQYNLTYATVPLTLARGDVADQVSTDADPAGDLDDVKEDVGAINAGGGAAVAWGWYQEGYDREPTDVPSTASADPVDAEGRHASYVTHHNGPQYFGYIANNPRMRSSMHGLDDFRKALDTRSLPAGGGLFYIKGGYQNILGLHPADPDPKVQASFVGDDDHPAYSDSQISEAMIADDINRIARSPYWSRCAIIITWDDSEGDYDHVPPPIRSTGPDGVAASDGPRVPLIVISPYARVHTIDTNPGDHASVVKFADMVFGLKPLADLPDELEGRKIGERQGLRNEGPFDDLTEGITDLLGAFDPARLDGKAPALPADYAVIPDKVVMTIPPPMGWHDIGVTPSDYQLGITNVLPPRDFNPRPRTNPTPDAATDVK
ncbi:MAG: phospholipase C [Capsulimonadaceae bacterium]